MQFRGPYAISGDMGNGRFRVQDDKGNVLKKTVSCHRKKLWLIKPNKKQMAILLLVSIITALIISNVVCLTWFAQSIKLDDKCNSEKVNEKTQKRRGTVR